MKILLTLLPNCECFQWYAIAKNNAFLEMPNYINIIIFTLITIILFTSGYSRAYLWRQVIQIVIKIKWNNPLLFLRQKSFVIISLAIERNSDVSERFIHSIVECCRYNIDLMFTFLSKVSESIFNQTRPPKLTLAFLFFLGTKFLVNAGG